MFNHHCPELSPNSMNPNITASSCKTKIDSRIGKCARCTSGVGYVAPVKEEKPERKRFVPIKRRKPRQPKKPALTCPCGQPRKRNKKWCESCRLANIQNHKRKERIKQIEARIKKDRKTLAAYKRALLPEVGKELAAVE